MFRYNIRLFVETDEVGATRVAEEVVARVGDFGTCQLRYICPYWKVPSYSEVLIRIESPSGALEQLGERFPLRWAYIDGGNLIWNFSEELTSVPESLSLLRWLHIEDLDYV